MILSFRRILDIQLNGKRIEENRGCVCKTTDLTDGKIISAENEWFKRKEMRNKWKQGRKRKRKTEKERQRKKLLMLFEIK